jgi:hypothetical protein
LREMHGDLAQIPLSQRGNQRILDRSQESRDPANLLAKGVLATLPVRLYSACDHMRTLATNADIHTPWMTALYQLS